MATDLFLTSDKHLRINHKICLKCKMSYKTNKAKQHSLVFTESNAVQEIGTLCWVCETLLSELYFPVLKKFTLLVTVDLKSTVHVKPEPNFCHFCVTATVW